MMATAFSFTGIAPMMLLLQACLMKAAEPIFDSVHQEHGDWQEMGAACAGERAILHHSLRCIVNPVGITKTAGVSRLLVPAVLSVGTPGRSSDNRTIQHPATHVLIDCKVRQ